MEPLLIYLLLAIVFLILLSIQILFYVHRSHFSATNLPPGATGWPIIGESLEFLKMGWQGQPERFVVDRMRRYSQLCFKTCILGEPMAVLSGPHGNKFLFSNENKLVEAWWPSSVDKIFPSSLQTNSIEEAKRMRALLPQFLKPDALKGYIEMMDQIAARHLDTCWANKEEIIVYPQAKRLTFLIACRLFMSLDDPNHLARLLEPFNLIASGIITIPIDLPGTPFNRAIKASRFIRKELREIIKQRKVDLAEVRATATQDILSHMLTTPVSVNIDGTDEYMNELNIADKILGLLVGGYDTASITITFIIKFLAELPHVYDQVYKEQMEIAKSKAPGQVLNWDDVQKMKYSWNVACEVMRVVPPQQGGFREALHDFSYGGFHIPKGWKLYWSVNSTHRNPKYFPKPEKFDPSRFDGAGPGPYTYVPFGGGPRMCPGKEYARLEILVFMHNVVKRFKWEKLIPDEKIVVNPLPVPAKGLPIRLHPRN